MTPERWQQIETVYHAALKLEQERRGTTFEKPVRRTNLWARKSNRCWQRGRGNVLSFGVLTLKLIC
jgi:hypothetical protein